MNLTGQLLIYAVVSVVPGFFVFLFASSAYRELKQRHAKWIQAELALKSSPTPVTAELRENWLAARSAYNQHRRTFWGAIWGAIRRLPLAEGDGSSPG